MQIASGGVSPLVVLLVSWLLVEIALGTDKNCVTTDKGVDTSFLFQVATVYVLGVCVCVCVSADDGAYLLCVETPDTVQVGQNTSFAVYIVRR